MSAPPTHESPSGLRFGLHGNGSIRRIDHAGIVYRVCERGHGPTALVLDGEALRFEREPNPYRTGAALMSLDVVRERLAAGRNRLVVELE